MLYNLLNPILMNSSPIGH